MNISLSQDLEAQVQSRLDSGSFDCAEDVIREALAVLSKQDDWIRSELVKGLKSIEEEGLSDKSFDEIADEVLAEYRNSRNQ